MSNNESKTGILIVGVKVLSKFLPKLLPMLKGSKFALGALSFASYAYLFTWQFAAVFIGMLIVHESGHLIAAKRVGLETKGIYLIPFLGGVMLAKGDLRSRKDEFYVAIMGPVFGLLFAGVAAIGYEVTHNPLFAAAAAWGALINLFNLLPIYPLDGGRIIHALSFSMHSLLGYAMLIAGLAAAGVAMVKFGLYFLAFLTILGIFEIFSRDRRGIKPLSPLGIAASAGATVALAVTLWKVMDFMSHVPGADLATQTLYGIGG